MSAETWREKDEMGARIYSAQVFETLRQGYRPFRGRILLSLAIGLLGRLLLLGNANAIGLWVDGRLGLTWGELLTLLAAMAAGGFVATAVFRIVFSRLSARAVSSIYDEVTLRTSRYPMAFFDRTPVGRIVTRFSSDYGNVFRLFGGPLAEFVSILFDLATMTLLIGFASPLFLPLVVVIGALNYAVYRLHRGRLRSLRRELSASRSPSIAHFSETTQGAAVIRAFRREPAFGERFDRVDSLLLERKLGTFRGITLFSFQMNALSALLLLGTGLGSIVLIQSGWLTVGAVGVAFTFITMSGNTLQMFFEWLAQLEEAMIGIERLDRYLRLPLEPGNRLPAASFFQTGHPTYTEPEEKLSTTSRLTTERSAAVEVNDLWFRYGDDLPWVLQGVSFSVAPGERLGVVGRTGSGKSSLIQALFRLYPLARGSIRVAGREAATDMADPGTGVDLNSYRRALAFIAQDPVLFQGTLRSNLDIDGTRDDEELMRALDRVGLAGWAASTRDGLDTPIAERGKNLSAGERQLVCMARCLLQDSPVIVMDEATSSIDPQSEEILVRATDDFFRGRTQILIAHRLSTLRQCDRVLWLEEGRIRQWGPAAEVLAAFQKNQHSDLMN